ncbi:MAG: FprA family A-type flavoprotein [Lachnospiraceae bacterium]|nr:FprA family A-type flavoprotein [Lachnospiraceae bacterium]
MVNTQEVVQDTRWIGGSDRRIALFENIFPLENGVSYNSYLVTDEKTVLFDTADIAVSDQFLENLQAALAGRKLDYLVVLHMEPDHCSQIRTVAALYPGLTLVGNAKTFTMMQQFFPETAALPRVEVKEGDTLSSGKHTYHFVMAPMVHWPEAMFAYDDATKALFSADAFGTFGALDAGIFADEVDFEKKYLDEARRYYANIVGKYGMQVQAVLKKAAGLDIAVICPLHGPVWRKDLAWFIDKYDKWSRYEPEDDGIVLIYGSLYGHTASAAALIAHRLEEKSGKTVRVFDVSKTHSSCLVGEIWKSGTVVLASPTYNNGIYLPMQALLHDLRALGLKNRKFALIENGTWAPVAGKLMREELAGLTGCTVVEETLTIKSALHETDSERVDAFVEAVTA